jgi:hypothetical protein
VYRRLKAVQLVADGFPLREAARLSDVGRTRVDRLLRDFAAGGRAAGGAVLTLVRRRRRR